MAGHDGAVDVDGPVLGVAGPAAGPVAGPVAGTATRAGHRVRRCGTVGLVAAGGRRGGVGPALRRLLRRLLVLLLVLLPLLGPLAKGGHGGRRHA